MGLVNLVIIIAVEVAVEEEVGMVLKDREAGNDL